MRLHRGGKRDVEKETKDSSSDSPGRFMSSPSFAIIRRPVLTAGLAVLTPWEKNFFSAVL